MLKINNRVLAYFEPELSYPTGSDQLDRMLNNIVPSYHRHSLPCPLCNHAPSMDLWETDCPCFVCCACELQEATNESEVEHEYEMAAD